MNKTHILLFCLALASCSEGLSEKQKLAAIELDKTILALTCEAQASHKTPLGDLRNNVGKTSAAAASDWTQCLAMRTVDAKTQYGWYWQWPAETEGAYTQPQITLGNSPLLKPSEVKPSYPLSVARLSDLVIDYDLEMLSEGEVNLLATLWLTNSATINLEVDESSIAAQVSIWTYSSEGFTADPAGEHIGYLASGGAKWQVWVDQQWRGQRSKNQNNWVYLIFRAEEPAMHGQVNGLEMLRHAISQKLIADNLFIADIQFGTEVHSGTGQAWLNHYQVDIRSD